MHFNHLCCMLKTVTHTHKVESSKVVILQPGRVKCPSACWFEAQLRNARRVEEVSTQSTSAAHQDCFDTKYYSGSGKQAFRKCKHDCNFAADKPGGTSY